MTLRRYLLSIVSLGLSLARSEFIESGSLQACGCSSFYLLSCYPKFPLLFTADIPIPPLHCLGTTLIRRALESCVIRIYASRSAVQGMPRHGPRCILHFPLHRGAINVPIRSSQGVPLQLQHAVGLFNHICSWRASQGRVAGAENFQWHALANNRLGICCFRSARSEDLELAGCQI